MEITYQELRARVFAQKQKEAAKQLLVEAERHDDYEALVYAHLVINWGVDLDNENAIRVAFTEFFGENPDNDEMLKAHNAYLGLLEKKLVWADEKCYGITKRPVCYKTTKQLQDFVRDCLNGAIFTSYQIVPGDWENLLGMIFMPLAFGALNSEHTDLNTVGIIYEYNSKAGPRSVNGYPIFFGCHMMHTEDWNRALKAILREQKRMEKIKV